MTQRPKLIVTMAAICGLDQLTKYLAAQGIDPFAPVAVLPFFNLVNVRNQGAAFGIMSTMGNAFFIAVSVLAIAFVAWLLYKGRDGFFGLTLVLSGATGNLVDRATLGYVRDFLDFHAGGLHWPAFNVADSALTVGIALVLLGTFRHRPAPKTQP